jgi:YaiO family outer membrane protein
MWRLEVRARALLAAASALALGLLLAAPSPARAGDVLEEARAEAEAGDTSSALALLDARLADHPEDRDAQFLRARVLAWSGDYDASRRAFDELIAPEPRNADYLLGRAQAWLWAGEPERALEDVRAARAAAPDYEALVQFERQALDAIAAKASAAPRRTVSRTNEVAAEATWEHLDSGYDDWRTVLVRGRASLGASTSLRGSLAQVGRYDTSDTEAAIGASWSAGERFEIGADASTAGSADFLPEWTAQGYAAMRLWAATRVQAGFRHAQYRDTRNDTLSLSVEQYVSRYRFAYSLFRGDPADATRTWTHVLRLDLYYADSGSVGAQYTTGEESESDGGGGLLVSEVEGVALIGRNELGHDWTVSWALTWHDQGELYRRAGINVGVARRF